MDNVNQGDDRDRNQLLKAKDDEDLGHARVVRQTMVAIHDLAIEQQKRIRELERNVRDIKFGVVVLLIAALVYAITSYLQRQ